MLESAEADRKNCSDQNRPGLPKVAGYRGLSVLGAGHVSRFGQVLSIRIRHRHLGQTIGRSLTEALRLAAVRFSDPV